MLLKGADELWPSSAKDRHGPMYQTASLIGPADPMSAVDLRYKYMQFFCHSLI